MCRIQTFDNYTCMTYFFGMGKKLGLSRVGVFMPGDGQLKGKEIQSRYNENGLEFGDLVEILKVEATRTPLLEALVKRADTALVHKVRQVAQDDSLLDQDFVQRFLTSHINTEPRMLRLAIKCNGTRTVGLLFCSKLNNRCVLFSPLTPYGANWPNSNFSIYNDPETLVAKLKDDFSGKVDEVILNYSDILFDVPVFSLESDRNVGYVRDRNNLFDLIGEIKDENLQQQLREASDRFVRAVRPLNPPTYSERLIRMTKESGKDLLVLIDKSKEKSKDRIDLVQEPSI
jgi:hypothetical protein